MPELKNQHFVPRCLLKPFTLDRAGKCISLYAMAAERLVQSAPVKNQCSRDYFYGEDLVIERTLQPLESESAAIISAVDQHGFVLTQASEAMLRLFWLVQHQRTEATSQYVMSMVDGIADLLEAPGRRAPRIDRREAVQIAMSSIGGLIAATGDMKVCLLRNNTEVPFVLGDDPATLANKWHDLDARAKRAPHGMKSAGAIFLMPLTPKVAFVQYDPDVYAVESKQGWVTLRSTHDVNAINQHQYLSAISNVYFSPFDQADYVVAQATLLKPARPTERIRLWYGTLGSTDGGVQRFDHVARAPDGPHEGMVTHEHVRAKPTTWPSFLTWRFKGSVYTNRSGAGFVRRSAALEMNQQMAIARRGEPFRKSLARP